MTVTYMQHVHTAYFATFLKLLTLWRGSILKGVGWNIVIYCGLYYSISFVYRIILSSDEDIKSSFEGMCRVIKEHKDVLPLNFILGFYVTQVISRWWCQFTSLYWVDSLAMNLAALLPGDGQEKQVRRQLVRLANLSSVMALRRLSTPVAKRFPTFQHLVQAGLMTERELARLLSLLRVTERSHQHRKSGWTPQITWEPILWAQAALRRARESGMQNLDNALVWITLNKDLSDVASSNHSLISYSWVALPLVYTQLVTMAVYLYFFFTLFSSQNIDQEEFGGFLQVPVFTLLQFTFYFGWLHVAEVILNPFGEDDEDFDVNYLVDRNLQVSYLMVEGGDQEWQELSDPYCGGLPTVLPHTVESYKTTYDPPTFPTDAIRQDLALVRKDDLALNIEEGTWEGDWEGVWTTGEQEEGVEQGRLLIADPQNVSETKNEVKTLQRNASMVNTVRRESSAAALSEILNA